MVGNIVEFPRLTHTLLIDPSGSWLATLGGFSPCYCDNPQDDPAHPLIVWNLKSGVIRAQLEQKLVSGYRLAGAFDGENILMFYESGEITRWNFLEAGAEEKMVSQVTVRPGRYGSVAWSADSSRLSFSSRYQGVDVYEVATQQIVLHLVAPLDFQAFSQDGSLVAIYDPQNKLEKVFRVADGSLLHRFRIDPVSFSGGFSPDGRYLAFTAGMQAFVADLASESVIALTPTVSEPISAETIVSNSRVIWASDGRSLATTFGLEQPGEEIPGIITLWKRAENGNFREVYHLANARAGYSEPDQNLALFNPSGSRLALKSRPSNGPEGIELRIINVGSGRVVQSYPEYTPSGWAGDNLLLATNFQNYAQLVRINLLTGEKTIRYLDKAYQFKISPDGRFLVQMGTAGHNLKLLNEQVEEISRFTDGSTSISAFGWSPDGHWLYTAGSDGTMKIWPVLSNE